MQSLQALQETTLMNPDWFSLEKLSGPRSRSFVHTAGAIA